MIRSLLKKSIPTILTDSIAASYFDTKFDNTVDYSNKGYIEIPAKSKSTGETHIIRALNPDSTLAKEAPNLAKRAFLQETLRLCTICPDAILIDTFEIDEYRICYAMNPILSPMKPSSPTNIDFSKLLENLIADMQYITKLKGTNVSALRTFQIYEKNSSNKKLDNLPLYMVQDWGRVISKTIPAESDRPVMEKSALELTKYKEKVSVYQIATSIFKVGGLPEEELVELSFNRGRNYDRLLKSLLESDEISALKLSENQKMLLMEMLAKDPTKRPTLEELHKKLEGLEGGMRKEPVNSNNRNSNFIKNVRSVSTQIPNNSQKSPEPQKKQKIRIIVENKGESSFQGASLQPIQKDNNNGNENSVLKKPKTLKEHLDYPNPSIITEVILLNP